MKWVPSTDTVGGDKPVWVNLEHVMKLQQYGKETEILFIGGRTERCLETPEELFKLSNLNWAGPGPAGGPSGELNPSGDNPPDNVPV